MGIDCRLYAIDAQTARRLIANPRSAGPALMRCNGADGCDIHKAWHAIHYVLTGEAEGGPEPNCYLLDGGVLLGSPTEDYDPPRVLSPEQVCDFDGVLQPISRLSLLRERFDHEAMVNAGVYSMNEDEEDEAEDLEFTAVYFKSLRRFIHAAANNGDGVIITIG
jgi:Domain of unknown function (DUF1877)